MTVDATCRPLASLWTSLPSGTKHNATAVINRHLLLDVGGKCSRQVMVVYCYYNPWGLLVAYGAHQGYLEMASRIIE